MATYMVLVACLLICNTVTGGYYDKDDDCPLIGMENCEYYDSGVDPNCGYPDGGDELDLTSVIEVTENGIQATVSPDCNNTRNCAPALCKNDCECGGKSCSQRCYFGCQGYFDISQWDGVASDKPVVVGDLVTPSCDTKILTQLKCMAGSIAYMQQGGASFTGCENGQCGACAEPWCATLEVNVKYPDYGNDDSDLYGLDGLCERLDQTFCLPGGTSEEGEIRRTCTRNIRKECRNKKTGDDLLGYQLCGGECGYPFQCKAGEEIALLEPVNGITAFADLCPTKENSPFKVTKGACQPDYKPKCNEYGGYGSGGVATHVLQWDVVKLPKTFCDPSCGKREAHFSEWTECAYDDLKDNDDGCFAVIDNFGMDIGTCQLGSANAKLWPCNGDPEYCECPISKDNVQKENESPEIVDNNQQPPKTGTTTASATQSDTSDVATLVITTVIGIGFTHTML
jgi:hypothetical protein